MVRSVPGAQAASGPLGVLPGLSGGAAAAIPKVALLPLLAGFPMVPRASVVLVILMVLAGCAGPSVGPPPAPEPPTRTQEPARPEASEARARELAAEALDAVAAAEARLLRGDDEAGFERLRTARERLDEARELLPRATVVLRSRRGDPLTVRAAREPLEIPARAVDAAVLAWLSPRGVPREEVEDGVVRIDLDRLALRLRRAGTGSAQGALAELFLATETSVELLPEAPAADPDERSLRRATSDEEAQPQAEG